MLKAFTMCDKILLRNIIVSYVDVTSFVTGINNKLVSRMWGKRIVIPIWWKCWVGSCQECFSRWRGGHKSSALKENSVCNGGVGVAAAKIVVSTGIPIGRRSETSSTDKILFKRYRRQEYFERTVI